MSSSQAGALVKQPVRLIAIHRGQKLMDRVFQHTPIRIGRLVDNDVVLPFDFASRYHCELRLDNGEWTAVDLGSKNGLMLDATTRANEIKVKDGGLFRIQEVTIQLVFETAEEFTQGGFNALENSSGTSVTDEPVVKPAPKPQQKHQREQIRPQGSSQSKSQEPRQHEAHASDARRPMLNVDLEKLLLSVHPGAQTAKTLAVQMLVIWHDQVLEAKEIRQGSSIALDFLGERYDLGSVNRDKSTIKIPKGCASVGHSNAGLMQLSPSEPCAFRASKNLVVAFRYVPQSLDMAANASWVEERLVDPLLLSGALHGAAALTAVFVAPKHQVPKAVEPERFATIIVAPTPPQIIALQPTPTPTPLPMPSPTPPLVAKPEPTPKPIPKEIVIKKVVTEKKLRAVAIQRKQEIKPPEPPKLVAKEEPPAKMEPAPVAAPAPTPVFEAKKVGALAMLNALKGPTSAVPNVDNIQVSRAPANVSASVVGREAIHGTKDLESKLNESAKGGGTGKGDGVSGVAVGGKPGGGYKAVAGITGNRKIKGTVVGGATYTELSKNEGLTREQIMKVVNENQSNIQACYERSLNTNPDLVGRAEFEWEITPKGRVTFVKVKEATLKEGENLLDCVKGVITRMKFPVAKNGESTTPTIGLPFGRL